MPDIKTRSIQQRFSSGFLDEQLLGLIDIEQYHSGCRQAQNILTLPQGPARRRPGTEFIEEMPGLLVQNATVPTMPEGGTPSVIIDDDPLTTTTTTTNIGVINPYVVAHYDLGAAVTIEFVEVTKIQLDTASAAGTFFCQYSTDNIVWVDLFSFTLTPTGSDYSEPGATARYWRIARTVGVFDFGTAKVTLADFLLFQTGGASEVRMGPFELDDEDQYLISFSDRHLRIYKDNARLIDLGTTYTSAEVKDVGFAQQDLAFIIVHEDHPPARLIRGATDADWSLTAIPFTNVPQFDFNDASSPTPVSYVCTLSFTNFTEGDRFQIELETALSEVITYTTNTPSLIKNVTKFVQDIFLLGDTGVSVTGSAALLTLTLSEASAGDYEQMIAFPTSSENSTAKITANRIQIGTSRKEDVWSATRGYPRNVAFYLSRMYFAGTKAKRQTLLGSRVGRFFDFDTGEGFDDDAIFITINTRGRNTLEAIVPARVLQLFSSGGEFAVSQKPITPTNATPDSQTNHGSSSVDPVEIDGSTLFIERKGRTLREFLFSFNEQGFLGASLSFLAQSLINTPVDMTALKGRSSDDSNYVFIVNTDGTMAVYNVLRSQGVAGFTSWLTADDSTGSGSINAVAVVDDTFSMAVKRNIDGVERNYLEFFSEDVLTDSALRKVQGTSATVTGLEHLEGEEVRVKLDGSIMDTNTVVGGQITMERGGDTAQSIVEVGLNYVPILQPMPVSNDTGFGLDQMSIKKIVETRLNVKDSLGIRIGVNDSDTILIPDRSFGEDDESPLDTTPSPRSGVIPRIAETLGFSDQRLQSVLITQDDPLPMTILSIETIVAG